MNALTILFAQPWAERLGWTLLHFLWQGTAIAVVVAVIRMLLGSAHSRHIVACLALAAMAAAPVVTFGWLAGGAASAPGSPAIAGAPAVIGQGVAPNSSLQSALPWLVMAWFAGVAGFSARLIGGWLSAARMRYSGARPAPAEWQATLDRLVRRMRVSRPVRLLVSARVETPAVLGWLRPVVLAPLGALTGLPAEHVEALLAHELAHIRRNDYLINVLQGIAEAVLFYHPAVWWVSHQIRTERELCCDDLAVAVSGDVLTYARALAELETCRPSRSRAAMAADGGSLLHRIARLLEPSRPAAHTMPGPGAAWALSLLLLLGIGMVAIRGARAEYTPQSDYPAVDRSAIWSDTVKQGDVPIMVRGLGILTSPATVEIKVAEGQMKDVRVGQAASVGFQKSLFVAKGRVTQIRPGVSNGTVTVDVQVEAVPPAQAQAMAIVDCTIQVGGLTNVVYVGRPVFHRAEAAGTLFRIEPDGNQAVRVKVQFGKASVNQIEILSGLQPGDKVIVSDMSKYDRQDRVYLK